MNTPDLKQLRNDRGAALDAARSLLDKADRENRALTTDESKRYEDQVAVAERLVSKIADAEARQEVDREAAARHFRQAIDTDGNSFPILAREERMADLHRRPENDDWTIANFVRASMGLAVDSRSVLTTGSATVPSHVSARIIDAVRQKARIIQAGAGTIPIEGKTTLARITSDPTVYEHAEGANDISESVPVLAGVELNPKTLVALVPLSAEIVADSPNLDAALTVSLASAFASKLDTLALATILADANIPTSAAGQATATWAGVLAAVGSMLAADQSLPGAGIFSPGDYIARASQLASTAGSWLGAPPILQTMLDLETSGVTDGTAILGDFAAAFAIAVRQELMLEVVRWAKPGYGSHMLVAHSRMAGYVLQPKHLYVQETTVE
jgi:HK97 family phage major capsid protein